METIVAALEIATMVTLTMPVALAVVVSIMGGIVLWRDSRKH